MTSSWRIWGNDGKACPLTSQVRTSVTLALATDYRKFKMYDIRLACVGITTVPNHGTLFTHRSAILEFHTYMDWQTTKVDLLRRTAEMRTLPKSKFVCACAYMRAHVSLPFQPPNPLTLFHETWHGCYATGDHPKLVIFNNNMANAQM
jgi:hypothetical protein